MDICVIRTDHLGDLVLTTPLFRALAGAGHHVDVVANEYTRPALDHSPHVRTAFAVEEIAPGFPAAWPRLGGWLRRRRYDVVILPFAKPRQLLLASLISGARRRIAMWGGPLARLTLHTSLRSRLIENPRHMSDIWLDCARFLGVPPAGLTPELFLTDAERLQMRADLQSRFGARKVILLHPGCGGNTCNLPDTEYARLATFISQRTNHAVVITGSPRERATYERWPAEAFPAGRSWLSAGQLSLRQFIALIGAGDLLICVGTGPLHIASALGKTTLSPFCPYVGICAQVWGNLGGPAQIIEPPRDRCPLLADPKAHVCSFPGTISAESLFARIHL